MHYFAKFVQVGPHTFRLDTRIYLKSQTKVPPKKDDRVVACVICKNPGSATGNNGSGLVNLNADNTLQTIKSVFEKAYKKTKQPPPNGYIQVLNLFYLCNPNLAAAIKHYQRISNSPTDSAERKRFPVTWFAWGGPHKNLDPMKKRFLNRTHRRSIYLDYQYGVVMRAAPNKANGIYPKVKHPERMPHAKFVTVLSGVLRRSHTISRNLRRCTHPMHGNQKLTAFPSHLWGWRPPCRRGFAVQRGGGP